MDSVFKCLMSVFMYDETRLNFTSRISPNLNTLKVQEWVDLYKKLSRLRFEFLNLIIHSFSFFIQHLILLIKKCPTPGRPLLT